MPNNIPREQGAQAAPATRTDASTVTGSAAPASIAEADRMLSRNIHRLRDTITERFSEASHPSPPDVDESVPSRPGGLVRAYSANPRAAHGYLAENTKRYLQEPSTYPGKNRELEHTLNTFVEKVGERQTEYGDTSKSLLASGLTDEEKEGFDTLVDFNLKESLLAQGKATPTDDDIGDAVEKVVMAGLKDDLNSKTHQSLMLMALTRLVSVAMEENKVEGAYNFDEDWHVKPLGLLGMFEQTKDMAPKKIKYQHYVPETYQTPKVLIANLSEKVADECERNHGTISEATVREIATSLTLVASQFKKETSKHVACIGHVPRRGKPNAENSSKLATWLSSISARKTDNRATDRVSFPPSGRNKVNEMGVSATSLVTQRFMQAIGATKMEQKAYAVGQAVDWTERKEHYNSEGMGAWKFLLDGIHNPVEALQSAGPGDPFKTRETLIRSALEHTFKELNVRGGSE